MILLLLSITCAQLSTASFITRGKPTPPPSRHDSAYVNSASDVSLVSAMKQTRSFTVSGSMDPKSGFGQRRSGEFSLHEASLMELCLPETCVSCQVRYVT